MDEIMEDAAPAAQPASSREESRAIAMMTSPWIEKYRPDSLSDIIAHQDIMTTCESLGSHSIHVPLTGALI
jgi:hypothetical protein